MANNVRVAHKFFVAEGEEGEIYIFLDASKDKPENPRIVYDGKDHAVFCRHIHIFFYGGHPFFFLSDSRHPGKGLSVRL